MRLTVRAERPTIAPTSAAESVCRAERAVVGSWLIASPRISKAEPSPDDALPHTYAAAPQCVRENFLRTLQPALAYVWG